MRYQESHTIDGYEFKVDNLPSEGSVWEVERLLKRKVDPQGKVYYKVQWKPTLATRSILKRYSQCVSTMEKRGPNHYITTWKDSWELEENISFDLIEDFWENKGTLSSSFK